MGGEPLHSFRGLHTHGLQGTGRHWAQDKAKGSQARWSQLGSHKSAMLGETLEKVHEWSGKGHPTRPTQLPTAFAVAERAKAAKPDCILQWLSSLRKGHPQVGRVPQHVSLPLQALVVRQGMLDSESYPPLAGIRAGVGAAAIRVGAAAFGISVKGKI